MSENKQFCTFYLDTLFFGVEVEKIQEVFRYHEMTSVPLSSRVVKGLINLRGQIITAIDLRRRLEMPDLPAGRLSMNVVVRTDEGVVSLLVDEIGDVLEVQAGNHEMVPDTVTGVTRDLVSGVYKLKENLLLVLDPNKALRFEPTTAQA